MRFYINILSTYYPDIDPPYEVYYRQMLEQIELAEELGFECFMFNEHHFLGYGGLIANPAVMLAAAATRTSRIRLGPCIAILSVRHPLQVAEDYAMVGRHLRRPAGVRIGLGNTALDYRVFETPQEEGRARYQEAPRHHRGRPGPTNASATRASSGNSVRSRCIRSPCRSRYRSSGWPAPLPRGWGGLAAKATTS